MPIGSWTVDPDLLVNEAAMLELFHGYEQEKLHWPKVDKEAIQDPQVVEKIRKRLNHIGPRFDIYFAQSRNPDYDQIMQKGQRSRLWVSAMFGPDVGRRFRGWLAAPPEPGSVRILMTNNLSDESPISLRSPWMVVHRIAHALLGGNKLDLAHDVLDLFEKFVFDQLVIAYGYQWCDWHWGVRREEDEVLMKLLGNHLGTMRSARDHALAQSSEWVYETLTQYLIQGRIRLNPLPDRLDQDFPQTTDPIKRRMAELLLNRFQSELPRLFDQLLQAASGEIFVI